MSCDKKTSDKDVDIGGLKAKTNTLYIEGENLKRLMT